MIARKIRKRMKTKIQNRKDRKKKDGKYGKKSQRRNRKIDKKNIGINDRKKGKEEEN